MSVASPLALLLCLSSADAAPLVASWDLESSDAGFTTDEIVPIWQWGIPLVGPDAAATGTRVWGTALDGNYISDNDAALILPPLNIEDLGRPVLRFSHWLAARPGDEATVQAWTETAWVTLSPVYGYADGGAAFSSTEGRWREVYVDLTGVTDTSDVRLMLSTDASGVSEGWYVDDFQVYDGDIVPPAIEDVSAPASWDAMSTGPVIEATVYDDVGLATLTVVWSLPDQVEQAVTMATLGGDRWQAILPAVEPGQDIRFHIEASDGANLATWPEDGDATIAVHLPAPTDLQTDPGRLWGLTVPLSWSAPVGAESASAYVVLRDDVVVAETSDTRVDAPAAGPVDTFTVRGIFDTDLGSFEGDASDPLSVEVAVPVIEAVEPDAAWQGDRLRLVLTGADLLLQGDAGATPTLDLGSDVTVEEVTVDHVDRASFLVQIDDDARVGPRDVFLETGGVRLSLVDGFEVLDGADRPAVLSVTPDGLDQGASSVLHLVTNTTFSTTPTASLGAGVVVEDVQADGAELWLTVAVANDAEVGVREIEVDDGTRILDDATQFRVRPRPAPAGNCRAVPTGGGWGVPLLLLAPLWTRRRKGGGGPIDRRPPGPDGGRPPRVDATDRADAAGGLNAAGG